MRFLSLDLEKFGAFEGLRFAFRPDAKLHVVYGPNGAGKSTALAAVGALLFGVPNGTLYAFRFDRKDLRIDAEITARGGRSLAFRRRHSLQNRNTLLDPADKPLPEDSLAPFLGAIGVEVFHRSFGLNATSLREGGEAMLRADGDLGVSMMAAASGLRALTDLRQKFDADADKIFGERRAEHRHFYQALGRFEAARKTIREKELGIDAWRKLNKEIESVGEALERLRADRRTNAAEHSRLNRLKRVAPVLRDIAAYDAKLEGYSDLPAFAPGAAEQLRAALEQSQNAAKDADRAREDETKAAEELAGIAVDDTLLSEAAAIEELFQERGGYVAEKRDLPRIQAEADKFSAALESHTRALGLPDAGSLEAAQPTAAAIADLRKLLSDGRQLEAAQVELVKQVAQERKDFEAARLEREQQRGAIDPGPLHEKFTALGKVGEQARRLSEERVRLAIDMREFGEAVARIDPPVADLDALARARLPRGDDLAGFVEAFKKADDDLRDAAKARDLVEKEIAGATARLAELVASGSLATADIIKEARAARDATWGTLRSSLLNAADAPPSGELPTLIVEFERRSDRADRVSDEAALNAETLAKHALETRRLDEQTRSYALALAEVDRASARRAAVEQDWARLWNGVCPQPRAPTQMHEWSAAVERLLKTRDKLLDRRDAQQAGDADLARIEPAMRALAAETGVSIIEELDCARLADRVERRLRELASAWTALRDLDTRSDEARRRLDRGAADCEKAARQLGDWRARWASAVAAFGLDASASIEAAAANLEVWQSVLNDAQNHRDRARRVDGMKRDMQQFEAKTADLLRRCASDLGGLPSEASIRVLNERLGAARKADALRQGAERRLQTARARLAEAQSRAVNAAQALASVAASLPPGSDPSEVLAREEARAELVEKLGQARRHLSDIAEGVEEANLVDQLKEFDPDAAEARLRDLEQQDSALEGRINEVYAEREQRVRERDALAGGVGAEVAWQQRRNAEAELVEAARRWAVLKAASLLLGKALERHSAVRRDPLMTRAGAIFATLTGGAFSGLDQSFDEKDQLRLVARRSNNELVAIKGLSDGERDQVYFALRLAYIEDYAARAESPPFIGDDIFPSFDDPRTAHGLEALAAISDRVQPILFTHHEHVVEAARARLGDAADIILI